MEDLNKISSTRVGDNIHFYVNGQENKGTVVKMDTSYVTVIKDDGKFQDIHINDTFFIKDILVNKTWNDMTMEERTVKLHEIKAYSPRFLAKSWQELPRELKVVLEDTAKDAVHGSLGHQSNVPKEEKQTFAGQATRTRHGDGRYELDTNHLSYDDEYPKGVTQPVGKKPTIRESPNQTQNPEHINDPPKGVKYGDKQFDSMPSGESPKDMEAKKSNVEQGHYGSAGRASHVVETSTAFDADEDYEGESHDTKEEQFKHDKEKPKVTNKTMQEQLWEDWLSKDSGGNMGDGGAPAQTSMTTGTTGVYNAVYSKDGRIKGQEKDKEEDTEKDKEEKDDKDKKERKG